MVSVIKKSIRVIILFLPLLGCNLEGVRHDMGISLDSDSALDLPPSSNDTIVSSGKVLTSDSTKSATSIYKEAVNSTVTIYTNAERIGSGFFIAPNLIVTNFHVIKNSTEVRFKLNNLPEYYEVSGFVAVNKNEDLILLQSGEFVGTPLSLSNRKLDIGQKIFVIGSPDNLPATISDGIISALRNFTNNSLVQITAPISPGSSGGPVLNEYGEVIGVSVMYLEGAQNINFAIPSQSIKTLIDFKKDFPVQMSNLIEDEPNSSEATSQGDE